MKKSIVEKSKVKGGGEHKDQVVGEIKTLVAVPWLAVAQLCLSSLFGTWTPEMKVVVETVY